LATLLEPVIEIWQISILKIEIWRITRVIFFFSHKFFFMYQNHIYQVKKNEKNFHPKKHCNLGLVVHTFLGAG
jgi:hypothetical protein